MASDIIQSFPFLADQKSDVIFNRIGDDFNNGIISCGFLRKETSDRSQYDFSIGFYSCVILLSGSGTYIGSDGRSYPLTPGCLLQRLPDVVHTTLVHPDGQWLEFFINFGKSTYDYLQSLGLISSGLPVRPCLITQALMKNMLYLFHSLKKAEKKQLPLVLMEAQKLVVSLYDNLVSAPSPAAPQEEIIRKACSYLNADLKNSLLVKEAADEVNMGYESFRKLFKQVTGLSPLQYRTIRRMEQAKLILLSGTSIKETADLVGYADCYSFSRQFKKTTGLSPARFRRSAP